MRTPIRPAIAAAAAGLLISTAVGAAAQAQTPAPQAAPKAAAASGKEHGVRGHRGARGHRQADLMRQALNLRPDQQAAWDRYQAALRPDPARRQADRGARGGQHRQAAPQTTPERLDAMQARMRQRLQRFEQRAAATRQFYAALDADQKRTFDAVTQMRGRKGGFARGHGGRRMHMHQGMRHPAGAPNA